MQGKGLVRERQELAHLSGRKGISAPGAHEAPVLDTQGGNNNNKNNNNKKKKKTREKKSKENYERDEALKLAKQLAKRNAIMADDGSEDREDVLHPPTGKFKYGDIRSRKGLDMSRQEEENREDLYTPGLEGGKRRGNKKNNGRSRDASSHLQPMSFVRSGILMDDSEEIVYHAPNQTVSHHHPAAAIERSDHFSLTERSARTPTQPSASLPLGLDVEEDMGEDEEEEMGAGVEVVRYERAMLGTTWTQPDKEEEEEEEEEKIVHVGGSRTFGRWEQHTTGFGLKMLQKMGYQDGQGLGKSRQGRHEPIRAVRRPKRQGLGHDD